MPRFYKRRFTRFGGRRYKSSAVGAALTQIIVGLILLWAAVIRGKTKN